MSPALPSDYDKDDGYDEEKGLEQCAHCERQFGGQGGHHETVYDQRGREFEFFLDTDPAKGPYFCPDCWPELAKNRRAAENHSLSTFAGGGQ